MASSAPAYFYHGNTSTIVGIDDYLLIRGGGYDLGSLRACISCVMPVRMCRRSLAQGCILTSLPDTSLEMLDKCCGLLSGSAVWPPLPSGSHTSCTPRDKAGRQ